MIRRSLARTFGAEIAIDLGTANTLIYVRDSGIVLDEPSVVAIYRDEWGQPQVECVGADAREMIGRTPGDLTIVRPIRDGVISNFEVTTAMLKHFISKAAGGSFLIRPNAVIAVPAGLNTVERRAVREAATRAGCGDVVLIQEAVAAAIGAGVDVHAAEATMVVDIGGGTTEVAMISCSGIIYSRSTRVGGDLMNEAIVQKVRDDYNVLIGELTAERLKAVLATSQHGAKEALAVKGRDLISNAPRTLEIKREEIAKALAVPVRQIVDRVLHALQGMPPETSADIADRGILLVGGGSLIACLEKEIHARTGLPVSRGTEPLKSIVLGAGACLEDELLRTRLTARN